jgi:cell division protein FtsW (lipid II flippase)
MEPIDLMETDNEREEVRRKVSKRRRVLLRIMLVVIPIYLIFLYFHEEDTGRTASLVLAVAMVAVAVRWDLRKHLWFWATVVGVFALHLPLILEFRWPDRWISGVELAGIALPDLLIILGCIWLVEKLATAIGSTISQRRLH